MGFGMGFGIWDGIGIGMGMGFEIWDGIEIGMGMEFEIWEGWDSIPIYLGGKYRQKYRT
jgi:hypothetical protein